MELPLVKKGDKILLVKSNNSAKLHEGKILEVLTDKVRRSGSISCKLWNCPTNCGSFSVFYDGPSDEFTMADRPTIAKYYKAKAEELREEIEKCLKEADYYENYESDEEFVAEKLHKLLNSDTKEKMTEVLKELRKSNLL